MVTASANALCSGMKTFPLLMIVVAVLSVTGKATSLQNNPDRETAYRGYRGETADEDSVARNLDSIGGGHLLRDLDGLPNFPRRTRSGLDSLSGVTFGWNKRLDSLSGITFGNQKRNFDEIDRSGFNGFVKKNFDEIDRSGFDGFVKKNFDEIDRVGFGSFVKRSAPLLTARGYDNDKH